MNTTTKIVLTKISEQFTTMSQLNPMLLLLLRQHWHCRSHHRDVVPGHVTSVAINHSHANPHTCHHFHNNNNKNIKTNNNNNNNNNNNSNNNNVKPFIPKVILFISFLLFKVNLSVCISYNHQASLLHKENHHNHQTTVQNPSFSKPIENATSVLGRSATLECSVDNLGSYKVAWLKMDSSNQPTVLTIGTQTLFGENKYKVTQNGQRQWYLHIKHVRVSDRGNYMCQVNAETMISQVGFLDVQIPPIIMEDRTSSDTTVDEHQKAVLKCTSKGYPRPKISWRREDGQPLNLGLFGGKKFSAQTYNGDQLNLTQVTREDMGAYLCIASNGVPPSLSKRILLHVNFGPKIRVQNQLIDARIGSKVELVCQCEAYPRPMVTWISPKGVPVFAPSLSYQLSLPTNANNHHNNSSSNPSFSSANNSYGLPAKYSIEEEYHGYRTTMRLKIDLLSAEDFGSFKCLAKNTMGEKEGLIRLYESQSKQFKNALSVQHKKQQQKHQNDKDVKANRLKSRKSLRRKQQSDSGNQKEEDEEDDTDELEEEGLNDDADTEESESLLSGSIHLLTGSSHSSQLSSRHQTIVLLIATTTVSFGIRWILCIC